MLSSILLAANLYFNIILMATAHSCLDCSESSKFFELRTGNHGMDTGVRLNSACFKSDMQEFTVSNVMFPQIRRQLFFPQVICNPD